MNGYLIFILTVIIVEYILGLIVDILNVRHTKNELPQEFEGYYDAQKYAQSQQYLRENTRFSVITGTLFTFITLVFILIGGFNYVDRFARSFYLGPIVTGLVFSGVLMLISQLMSIPVSAYSTFVIEEKYGFNKTTVKTFFLDIIKGILLIAVIGSITLSAVLWFFAQAGELAWMYCWVCVTLFQLFMMYIAPVVIMPLFNKFVPLEDGELKSAIENYAKQQNFKMKGVFKMDGSKRSTKANAFFTGFGKFRRIVLFDTLIEKHTVDELTSVLAHEMGHFRKRHIQKGILLSIITTGLMFLILSLFINNAGLFAAFKMEHTSIYASLIFFAFLYTPINMLLSVLSSVLSRQYEYEADGYAIRTYKKPEAMITALKKLCVDNLANLTPHPLKVFLSYSHPPVLKRIQAIRDRIKRQD